MKTLNNFLNLIANVLLSAYGIAEQRNYILIALPEWAIFVNDVEAPNSRFLMPSIAGVQTVEATLDLVAGDIVDVRNVSSVSQNIASSGTSLSASVSVAKVS